MTEKRSTQRRLNISLAAHLLLYVLAWAAALYQLLTLNFAFDNFDNTTRLITVILLWLPLLALHVGLYLYATRRWLTPSDERTAYRQGYADALRQFADEAYDDPNHVDDDETVVNIPRKDSGVKRKRSG